MDKPRIIVVGAAWYGDWARLVYEAYRRMGFGASIIYNNAAPAALGGNNDGMVSLFEKSKRWAKRYLAQSIFRFLKTVRRRLSEYEMLSKIGRVDGEKEKVIVLFVWTPGSPWVLRKLRAMKGIQLVLWLGEPPIRDRSWEETYDYFDHVFIVDEGLWMDEFPEKTKKRAILLPLSSDGDIFFKLPSPVKKYKADISFVGQYVHSRAATLSMLKEYDLKIYGFGWERGFEEFPWLREKYLGPLPTADLNSVYNSTKVLLGTLGDPTDPHTTTTMRTFDIALAGGFQISQKVALTKKIFGDTVCLYDNDEEMVEKVKYYLAHEAEREKLAAASHEIALGHTYTERAKEILRTCGFL